MDRRDYVLRMIEQFGRFALALRKLLLAGKAGSVAVGQELRTLAQHAGLDLDLARAVTPETLAVLVAPSGEPDPARCWMYGETLYLDGLDAELSSDVDRARASYMKARLLFSMVAPYGAFLVGFPEAGERMAEIDRRLAELAGEDDGGFGERTSRPRRLRRRTGSASEELRPVRAGRGRTPG